MKQLLLVTILALPLSVPFGVSAAEGDDAEEYGRVEFDFEGGPAANVEVDLRSGMLSALTEITQSALEGVAKGLDESSDSAEVKASIVHIGSAKEVLGLVGQAVREVRVRVYENWDGAESQMEMVEHYQEKLKGTRWENVVRVRDERESVIVCVRQHDSAIRGVFLMVADGNDVVLANVVCDLTPERVQELTNKATLIGMQFGLENVIEDAMRQIGRGRSRGQYEARVSIN